MAMTIAIATDGGHKHNSSAHGIPQIRSWACWSTGTLRPRQMQNPLTPKMIKKQTP